MLPDLSGYDYYRLVSVTGNKPAAAQAWFPMLVAFDTDAGLNDHTQNAGLDIAFCVNGDNTELPYEREQWTDHGANVTARFWVRVPSVASVADTDLRMHIGKAAGTAYATPSDTWNENGANDFVFVSHMKDVSPGIEDSTAYGNDGTKVGTVTEVGGVIDQAEDLEGTADYITITGDATAAELSNMAELTLEAIIYPHTWGEADHGRIVSKRVDLAGNRSYEFKLSGGVNEYAKFETWNVGGAGAVVSSVSSIALNNWYHVAATYKDGEQKMYIDGTNDGSDTDNVGDVLASTSDVVIGSENGLTRDFNGVIDEVRISKTVRGAAWLGFGHDNIANYGATITHGAWTATSVASGHPAIKRFGGVPFAALNRGVW